MDRIRVRAPGRICLFGEHQDYLGFPVIGMAISKYIYLEAKKIAEPFLIVDLLDLKERFEIKLNNKEIEYTTNRDYLKSGYNHFIRKRIKFNKGYQVKISGDIPINAGVASSSALIIAWLYFLNLISGMPFTSSQLALEGYASEVEEFHESGGMMDHFISVHGNLIYLKCEREQPSYRKFNVKLDGFVLGNSLEKKDTVKDLILVKKIATEAFNALKEIMPQFDPHQTSLKDVKLFLPNLNKEHQEKIIGNIINRDLTRKASELIRNSVNILKDQSNGQNLNYFYQKLGTLLNQHHEQLKMNIKISTKKIDTMITNCLNSGALGAKINGSGFGGTMFALAPPGKESELTRAIENAGGEPFIIKTSNGVKAY